MNAESFCERGTLVHKGQRGLDTFRRTPARRYDLPPREETRAEHASRFRKRHFDLPSFQGNTDRALTGVIGLLLVLVLCNASAPMGEVPDVQARFESWAAIQNDKAVKQLPGPTPKPESELYGVTDFEEQQKQQQQLIAESLATPDPEITPEPTSEFKLYEPDELSYQTDRLSVSIEQKHKDGITYFVCDIRISDVSQLRSAFAGDEFASGIYEAVSDIASRYNPCSPSTRISAATIAMASSSATASCCASRTSKSIIF